MGWASPPIEETFWTPYSECENTPNWGGFAAPPPGADVFPGDTCPLVDPWIERGWRNRAVYTQWVLIARQCTIYKYSGGGFDISYVSGNGRCVCPPSVEEWSDGFFNYHLNEGRAVSNRPSYYWVYGVGEPRYQGTEFSGTLTEEQLGAPGDGFVDYCGIEGRCYLVAGQFSDWIFFRRPRPIPRVVGGGGKSGGGGSEGGWKKEEGENEGGVMARLLSFLKRQI